MKQSNLSWFWFQIKVEAFLEDINNLLNAGEVPNIFPVDEKQEICEKMRQIERYMVKSGRDETQNEFKFLSGFYTKTQEILLDNSP